MRTMSPYDHFVSLFETDASPMNIGGLLLFDVPEAEREGFCAHIHAVLADRVPRSALARRMVGAPDDYDAPAWFEIDRAAALERIAMPDLPRPLDRERLIGHVLRRGMEPLCLDAAGFEIDIVGPVEGWGCALYLKMHHSLMDGIGFQSAIEQIADGGTGLAKVALETAEPVPPREEWLALASDRFEREADARVAEQLRIAAATEELGAFLADPANGRAPTPVLGFGAHTSRERAYCPVSIPLDRVRALGKRHGGSVNDIFMTLAGSALRAHLQPLGLLPDEPLIGQCVRSIRRPEDGIEGNRVVTMFPEIATDEPDPLARLARIRRNMEREKARSRIEERIVGTLDKPGGAAERKAALSDLAGKEATIGTSNVVLSNVPGPTEALRFGGYRLTGNYPLPIIGPGLFLNITLRRNADNLDLGVMTDAARMSDVDGFVDCLWHALEELEALPQRD
ncbi:MAG: WS/DGAT domain-containing protein [Blastomonas sp.]